MRKDVILANIYTKIHHKKPLTMDDLRYLALYAPECFKKTCAKVVNTLPETKPLIEPVKEKEVVATAPKADEVATASHQYSIDNILSNLRLLEANEFPVSDLDADNVKNLLGNMYMELLFEHNDKETIASMMNSINNSLFDAKI